MIARLFACVLLFCASDLSAQSRYEKWQENRPFTIGAMFYDHHAYPEARGANAQLPAPDGAWPDMELARQAGLNLFSDVSHSNGGHKDYPGVSTVQEAGLPFMILGAGWAGKGGDTALEAFQNHVNKFAQDSRWTGFCGVQLADEPRHKPEEPEVYRPQRDWLIETYPHLLTMFCEDISGYSHWERGWDVIRSDAIVFQWYPFHTSDADQQQISPGVYALLDRASRFCHERGIGFFVARETCHDIKPESVYRIGTYAALAHGATGFIDWTWEHMAMYTDGANASSYVVYDGDGEKPTALFPVMAKINREVANLGPALLRLRHVRTYHMDETSRLTWAGPIHHFTEPDELRTGRLLALAPKDQPIGVATPLLIGFFRDAQDQEYFMVVNKRHNRHHKVEMDSLAQQVTMTFANSVSALEKLDRETGEVERIELSDGHTHTFTLPAGSGELFKYANDAPFAGKGK